MNPLNDTKEHKVDPIYISIDLFSKIKSRGYNIFAVVGLALESYRYDIHIARNFPPTHFNHRVILPELQNPTARTDNSNSFIIELTGIDPNVMLGFLAYKIHGEIFSINFLSISKDHQRKGLGTLLMNCAEDIAKNLNVTVINLYALKDSIGFYEKLGMLKNESSMTGAVIDLAVDYPVFPWLNLPKYLDIALSNKQQLSRIPLKKFL